MEGALKQPNKPLHAFQTLPKTQFTVRFNFRQAGELFTLEDFVRHTNSFLQACTAHTQTWDAQVGMGIEAYT